MKSNDTVRGMGDDALAATARLLSKRIPADQSLLSAIQRECKRRRRAALKSAGGKVES